MANIEKNKEIALSKLNIQYADADKVKTSFGYIGITFLVVLFGSIFLNDFIKLLIYYFRSMREWWGENKQQLNDVNDERQKEHQVQIEMDRVYGEELEEKLERVYIRLLELNANRRN